MKDLEVPAGVNPGLAALIELARLAVVLAPKTLPGVKTLALPGVGVLVHCHLPWAKIQACPAVALSYSPVVSRVVLSGASSLACPPVLLIDNLVLALVKAMYAPGAIEPFLIVNL